jgi:hypothetical protein
VLPHQPLPNPPRRVMLLARRQPIPLSQPSISSRYRPSAGPGRCAGARLTGGTADAKA